MSDRTILDAMGAVAAAQAQLHEAVAPWIGAAQAAGHPVPGAESSLRLTLAGEYAVLDFEAVIGDRRCAAELRLPRGLLGADPSTLTAYYTDIIAGRHRDWATYARALAAPGEEVVAYVEAVAVPEAAREAGLLGPGGNMPSGAGRAMSAAR
jgi:hypothetical protein